MLLDKATRFYAVCCHPDVEDTIVEEYIHKLITFPVIFAVQDSTIERELEGVDASKVYNSGSAPPRPSPEDESKEPTKSEAGIKNITLRHVFINVLSTPFVFTLYFLHYS